MMGPRLGIEQRLDTGPQVRLALELEPRLELGLQSGSKKVGRKSWLESG